MKKKLFFLIFLPLFFLLVFGNTRVSAEIATQSSTPTTINYELPYPGVLPDNPLYSLKAARDKIISILINDQVKRAEFDLLTSDKRLAASVMLVNKGKSELAITTISKSNNYFIQAIESAKKAKDMGKNTNTVSANIALSLKKHKEILGQISSKIDKQYKAQLDLERKRLSGYEKLLGLSASE